MAHLIKLEDYISRYQFDLHRYPSQFARMKRERWYYMKSKWEQAQYELVDLEAEDSEEQSNFLAKTFQRITSWRDRSEDESDHIDYENERWKHMTLEEVKDIFLRDLFRSQLRWASSSLLEESTIHPLYRRDDWLRFFSQQFPDNYFLMYKPVFYIKKAPVELDLILISPTSIYCITLLEGHEYSVFEASSNRFWIEHINQKRKKRLSPLLSIARMETVIGSIMKKERQSFPIERLILSPNSLIDYSNHSPNVTIIDRRNFDQWHKQMKNHPSPLKHDQMKITSLLLDYCHTVSHRIDTAIEEQHEHVE